MTIYDTDEKYMARCIQLARNGKGFTSPNPMVGAVIVHDGRIIGEGYHRKYGESHAEVNAIHSVENQSLLKDSVMYVNLEPCSHYGNTPPCSELIISKQLSRVVIGHQDPYPEVSGHGIRMLKEAGIGVITGVLEEECRRLNKRFLTFFEKRRPYIILKWAQSSDGFLDKKRIFGTVEKPVRLSGDYTQIAVHKLRAQEDAILVGTRTALLDNPSLSTRFWNGKNPLRIAIDRDLSIPSDFHLCDGTIPTLIYTTKPGKNKENLRFQQLNFDEDILNRMMSDLFRRKVQSLIVEGGSILLNSFIQLGLWDEANIEVAQVCLYSGILAPRVSGNLIKTQKCDKSVIYRYMNE